MRPRSASKLGAKTLAAVATAAIAAIVSVAGCPGSLDDPGRFTTDGGACADVPTGLLLPTCGTTSGCHTADTPAASLDLASSGVATRVAGIAASATCGGGLLADPAHPTESILYQKVLETVPCGSRMPLGGSPLGDADKQCLLGWIGSLDASPATTTSTGGGGGAGGSGAGGSGGGS